MERYPTLKLIVRFGTPGAIALALVAAGLVLAAGWPLFGWWALVPAIVCGAIVGLLALSYVELVRLITEMLLPQ